MSDFRFRRLERHRVDGTGNKMVLSVPVPRSPSGKIYQYSPNPAAVPRLFLIGDAPTERSVAPHHASRIKRQPGSGETVCPYSGFEAPDSEFVHFDDVEAIKTYVVWAAQQDIGDWVEQMARDFNRGQPRGGLISMSMQAKRSYSPKRLVIREDLLREICCDVCQRQYGVYAVGLFCPDCGAPNVCLHFRREIELVQEQVALAKEQSEQRGPELAYRLMGNAHEDVLTAFEATLKSVYRYLVRQKLAAEADQLCTKRSIGNAFQSIDRGHELFAQLDIDLFLSLSAEELALLQLNIQKRHVIGHNLGMADEHYAELTQREQPGETVRLLGNEIGDFGNVCLKVVEDLEKVLLPSP